MRGSLEDYRKIFSSLLLSKIIGKINSLSLSLSLFLFLSVIAMYKDKV
jgi:hypothetical protein